MGSGQAGATDGSGIGELIATYLRALEHPDPGPAVRLGSELWVDHVADMGSGNGLAGFVAAHRRLHQTFGGFSLELHDQVVCGDRVALRLTLHGVHAGELFGIAPTGRPLAFEQIHIYRAAGDELVEHWAQHDQVALMHQLGLDYQGG
jgi:predicted ester cyclase